MNKQKNIVIEGESNHQIALDIFTNDNQNEPLVIYSHGFNGFKDWGNFDLIAEQFTKAGFCFLKFNFSHNGTTPEEPGTFIDLEAYGNNNYTKELNDLQRVIDWSVSSNNPYLSAIDVNKIYLIGHSRGGGIVLLKAAEEKRITAVATWASVAECKTPWGNWSEERIRKWEETGVDCYTNSRTGQQMPLYFQLYQDYQQHKDRLNILEKVAQLNIPILICHGTSDDAVPIQKAHDLKAAASNAELFFVASDHVFGRKHPWPHADLPKPMQDVIDKTIQFFQQQNKQ